MWSPGPELGEATEKVAKRALLSSDWRVSTSAPVRSVCDCAELKVGGREEWRRQSVTPPWELLLSLKLTVNRTLQFRS